MRNLVGIPMGFGFQNDITNPTASSLYLHKLQEKTNFILNTKEKKKKLHHEQNNQNNVLKQEYTNAPFKI